MSIPSVSGLSIIQCRNSVLSHASQRFSKKHMSRLGNQVVAAGLNPSQTGRGFFPSVSVKRIADSESHVKATTSFEEFESQGTVIDSTTQRRRTANLFSEKRNGVTERYVKGSVKYQIEQDQSFRVGILGTEEEVGYKGDASKQTHSSTVSGGNPDGSGEVSTSGSDEGVWSSDTYLRQLLMQRRKAKQVWMKLSADNAPTPTTTEKFRTSEIRTGDSLDSPKEFNPAENISEDKKRVDEDEMILRRALKKKRAIAEETLQSAIRAGGLGPGYCHEVMTRLSPFVDRIVTEGVCLKRNPAYRHLSFNSRARLYVDQCKVVGLIKWLKHQGLTAPRIGRLICLADQKLERIKPRIEFLKSIHVRGRELGVVVERERSILDQSLEELQRTVKILETAGVERKWLGLVVSRSPRIFSVTEDELVGKITMFSELGVSSENFGLIVFKFPAVLGRISVDDMLLKVDYLRELELEEELITRIIVSTPQILACSIEEAWDKILRYFYYLRIEISGIRRILAVQPGVLCLNLAENIAPKVRFLRAIGVDDAVIGQVIVNFPAVLTYSLDKKIRPVVRFLLEVAGVAEADVGKVIALKPELIGCSMEDKLEVVVKWFGSHRIPPRLLGGMIADFPALLMYSIPVLHPKIRYFKRVMKRPLDDIVAFPRYFSYSMETRIIPRHELLSEKGLKFSLRQMLACNDEAFRQKVDAGKLRTTNRGNSQEVVKPAVDSQQSVTVSCDEMSGLSLYS